MTETVPESVGRETEGMGIERVPVGVLSWVETPEDASLEETDLVGVEETRTVCMRLLVGAAGVASSARFFLPKVLAFLTDKPVYANLLPGDQHPRKVKTPQVGKAHV